MSKKLSRVEIFLLQNTSDNSNYNTYRCSEHGIYQKRKDEDDAKCVYCKKEHEKIDVKEFKKIHNIE